VDASVATGDEGAQGQVDGAAERHGMTPEWPGTMIDRRAALAATRLSSQRVGLRRLDLAGAGEDWRGRSRDLARRSSQAPRSKLGHERSARHAACLPMPQRCAPIWGASDARVFVERRTSNTERRTIALRRRGPAPASRSLPVGTDGLRSVGLRRRRGRPSARTLPAPGGRFASIPARGAGWAPPGQLRWRRAMTVVR
jgi:hypothetical protein